MNMMDKKALDEYRRNIEQAAGKIWLAFGGTPNVMIVLGSGLGAMAGQVGSPVKLSFDEIPGFPKATVPGHAGRMALGKWGNKKVAVFQGRFHAYEGHSAWDVVLPVRVMQHMGVPFALLTNASGGIDPAMKPGDLMLIRDHISFWAESPLRGPNLEEFGPRFPDQTKVYDRQLGDLAVASARELGIPIHEGVYAYCRGPQFETPAEIRMLRLLGATAAGMSTVPEAIAASHGHMRTLAISCITNLAAGILDVPLTHEEVLETAAQVSARTINLLTKILDKLPVDEKQVST